MRRILAMARKEVWHILRDRRSLAVAIAMPLVMVLLFGFAIDMEIRELPVAVLDRDGTPSSRALVRGMTSSGFIREAARLADRTEIETGFRANRFRAAIVIPRGFAERLVRGEDSPVQVLVDGADGTTASTADGYLGAVLAKVDRELAGPGAPSPPIDVRPRIRFNPELESAYQVVPGLVALVLMMICALLTSIALTREKETGTLEQVLSTPVSPFQVIVGKLLPYVALGGLDAALVLGVGHVVFGVPLEGSVWVLAGYSLVYVLIALALGLLISAVVSTQRIALMLALVATYLPTLLLSGFVFELRSMPLPLRYLGEAIPATHYIRIVRGILLKGGAWFPLDLAVLLGLLVILMTAATRRFRTTLE